MKLNGITTTTTHNFGSDNLSFFSPATVKASDESDSEKVVAMAEAEKSGIGIDKLYKVFYFVSLFKVIPFDCNNKFGTQSVSISVLNDSRIYLCYVSCINLFLYSTFQIFQWSQFLEPSMDATFFNLCWTVGCCYSCTFQFTIIKNRQELANFISRLQQYMNKKDCKITNKRQLL